MCSQQISLTSELLSLTSRNVNEYKEKWFYLNILAVEHNGAINFLVDSTLLSMGKSVKILIAGCVPLGEHITCSILNRELIKICLSRT